MIMSWAEEEEEENTEEIRGAREGGRPPPLSSVVRRRRRERASKERMDAGLSRNPARIILGKNFFQKGKYIMYELYLNPVMRFLFLFILFISYLLFFFFL